ncbi:hypothetical protein GPECTOR_24g275 [Gonium pectorale]|uniref:EF-hand domain-containing protein n=1 Tax=Gonium pectorale TaxID=33097 RepID=A0A150GH93_GONPE|nr:hypothetical protein GPECTOR_24g275 [Gonium pectorale]|eukprot:KXZ48985.1 hypothetical protein GPECTOR_24g275 [Gonium pectorale]
MSGVPAQDPAAQDDRTSAGRVKVNLGTEKPTGPQTIRTQSIMRQVGKGSVRRAKEIQGVLSELDRDHDGSIDVAELIDMVEGIVKSRRERRYMWFVIIALFVFAACTIGTIIGLTYAVVDALKDTEVTGSVMYVKGSVTDVVKVGSADFAVVNNVMVPRSAADAANPTNATSPSTVMQTAAFAGIRQPLSSRLPLETLFELKFLHVKGVGEAELGVNVNGVARVPLAGSVYGTVVRMITAAGTITLDGTVLTFSSQIADIFEEAGFRVSGSRRALLGDYLVFGFFNAIKDLTVFGIPSGQSSPSLPEKNYLMAIKADVSGGRDVYQPCTKSDAPNDLCVYSLAQTRRSLAAIGDDASSGAVARRVAQGTDTYLADIPGTVEVNGARWITYNETIVNWQGNTRTESYFAPYPGFRMVQLNNGADDIQTWQEQYDTSAPLTVLDYMFCRASDLPAGAKGMQLTNYILNFTYEGVDELAPTLYARRFKLTAKQPDTTDQVTVEYWDSPADNTPVKFHVQHPVLGDIIMEVTDFKTLTASSTEVASMQFAKPTTCPEKSSIPRLTSPYTYTIVDGADVETGMAARRRALAARDRMLASFQCENQPTISLYSGSFGPCQASLSAINYIFLQGSVSCAGTYGPISFAGSMTGSLCTLAADGCIQVDINVPSGNWLLNALKISDFTPVSACAVLDSTAQYITVQGYAKISMAVVKAEAYFYIKFSACCIWIDKITVEGYYYNIFGGSWGHMGSYTLMEKTFLRGSASQLTTELSYDASNINSWITVGDGPFGMWMDAKVCSSYEYSSGDPAKINYGLPIKTYQLRMDTNTGSGDKTALNGVKVTCSDDDTILVQDGLTGTWTSASASCSADGKFTAARMRIEAQKTGDNTAANSLQLKCDNGDAEVSVTEGYVGDWTGWATCPSGTYICGLQIKYQSSQGSKDDTAVNGAKIACCNAYNA